MKVKQISIFLENKSGRLAQVTRVLGDNGINIRALSIADTTDFGILRLIVSDPDLAYRVLKEAGFTVSATDVIAVEVTDEPGGLANAMAVLQEAGINIEYLYAFLQKASKAALVVFRVEQLDEAVAALQAAGIHILSGREVYAL
ncbi:ACT domain-containing protein [Desulfotomaculum copahuensis]|uniref:Amino acid-binding protein n=1 Tax=Desulfotomaculum copahuensis TaxID=1838280 RepID=A0A1B7LFJ5_9FIRM|nr:ACT domain-containing protein [Desulfotomaculum copahuensis]OAT82936.1 amino acid-binding protein [Desulfotomaculum copahuensis]